MLSFSAHQGRFLAGICVRKVQNLKSDFGQSTVVESIACPAIIVATKKLVQHLGYTGFGSVDFILDAQGQVHIIELNQRITKISHLGHFFGQDPLTALLQCVNGSEVNLPAAKIGVTVASFPYEWSRQPNSPCLQGLVDVPWAEAKMMQTIMKRIMPKNIKFV
ncbi:ATP-binding protein [Algibacillus agarilyticus]|uniref:ATP-binding protein n=1 Tax=Algibacillus agarilyticus TaxID=2234133 RepID=UPI000DD0B748|nr:hypothetical protein [Algibacillus agarilyticus]